MNNRSKTFNINDISIVMRRACGKAYITVFRGDFPIAQDNVDPEQEFTEKVAMSFLTAQGIFAKPNFTDSSLFGAQA